MLQRNLDRENSNCRNYGSKNEEYRVFHINEKGRVSKDIILED